MYGVYSNFNGRAYYYNSIERFIKQSSSEIIGQLVRHTFEVELDPDQRDAWDNQIYLLQEKLKVAGCTGDIIFEYDIVRLGKRIDVVLLLKHIVFSLEFKNGATVYKAKDEQQAEDYALNLKYFHQESKDLYICPILIATEAPNYTNNLNSYEDKQIYLQKANKDTIIECIQNIANKYGNDKKIDFSKWFNSIYCPTPTIIEAAIETYLNHSAKNIAHSEAGQANIDKCEEEVQKIIDYSKENHKKSICFITGVPGAGKTLVGLNIAANNMNNDDSIRSVYLSGNGPLVAVLRESLSQNSLEKKKKELKRTLTKEEKGLISSAVASFIQDAYNFRKERILSPGTEPIENVIIFDEAQRCWSKDKLKDWVNRKMKKVIDMSEPEYFIHSINEKKDWAVLICLVGLGQDIYDGEVGVNEWFESAILKYPEWDVYYSDSIFHQVEERLINKNLIKSSKQCHSIDGLHLTTSIRSYRSSKQSDFVDALLSNDCENAKKLYNELFDNYPVYITRDINLAKKWARNKVRGSERCGVIACSSAQRLKPYGLYVPKDIDVNKWFLAPKNDLRSSNAMEVVASEFKIQGLEIDWSVVCWDADLRRKNNDWDYYNFSGTKWNHRNKKDQKRYLLNAYRVLLTRARQGMVIFVPEGEDPDIDATRNKEFYNSIYSYLLKCGIKTLL